MKYGFILRLFNDDDEKFFGPGVAKLLYLVEEKGSLKKACEAMGMAYSKSYKMIKNAQEELGYNLLLSQTGGKNGGGAKLTLEGKEFLEKFSEFNKALEAKADVLFLEIF